MKRLSVIFIFLLATVFSVAQHYPFKHYSIEDGLAQSQVLSIHQDRNSYMWFGTNGGGVSKFDGTKFKTFTETDGLINNVVFSVIEDKKGNIYFGTNKGLSVYDGKTFTNYSTKAGLKNERIFWLFIDKKERIWVCTSEGAYQFDGKVFLPITKSTVLSKEAIFSGFADDNNNLWFGTTGNEVVKYNPETNVIKNFTEKNGLLGTFVRCFNQDNEGNVLIGTASGVYIVNKKDECKEYFFKSNINVGFLKIEKDKHGIWFLSNESVVYVKNNKVVKTMAVANGLLSNSVYTACVDRENNFWIGYNGYGVSKYIGDRFYNLTNEDGLSGSYFTSIAKDDKGNLMLGDNSSGITLINSNGEKQIFRRNKKDTIHSLVDDNTFKTYYSKKLGWIVGTDDGISIIKDNQINNYSISHVPQSEENFIFDIAEFKNVVYVATMTGLYEFNDGKFTKVLAYTKFAPEGARTVFNIEIVNDKLYLGTENGVVILNNGNCKRITQKDGFTDKRVSCIVPYGNSVIYGTDEAVFIEENGKYTQVSTKNGLSSNKVYLLAKTKSNDLLIGTNNGLDKIDLNKYFKNKEISIDNYTKEDGLSSMEFNSNAMCEAADGKIWLGTISGVTIYDPNTSNINTQEAKVNILNPRLFFENVDLSKFSEGLDSTNNLPKNLVLPFAKNHITFDFIGICLTNPKKVLYQFKLEGLDNDWFAPTSKTDITYSSLQPGTYTFMLKAMNNEGVWNKEPVKFTFTILPPWYRTWWFYTICALSVIGGVYFYNRYKTKKLEQDKAKLEKEVELRTHELREEKEKVELINQEVIAQKDIIEHKNEEITDSIKYAKNIQEALLPNIKLLKESFEKSYVLYMPKDIVSGDFYWFDQRGDISLFAAVDCTGHGVPGAFMSIIGNTLLNEIVGEQGIREPAEILNRLHKGVKEALNNNKGEFERRDGMDIALCAYNKTTKTLEYAGANRPLWMFRNDGSTEPLQLKADKFPIGGLELEEQRKFTNHTFQVNEGDKVYVFSDGYADQFGGHKGKKFMVGNMFKLVQENMQKPFEEQKQIMQDAFINWRGDQEQVDDVLVIGVEF